VGNEKFRGEALESYFFGVELSGEIFFENYFKCYCNILSGDY
jgi:hypothetical protein